MKIAIDASRANSKQRTGVENVAFEIILELVKVIPNKDKIVLYFKDKPQPAFENLGDNVELKILKWTPKLLWTQLRLSFQILIDRPNILYIPAHVIPLIHPKKTFVTLHDVAFKQYPEVYARKENIYQNVAVWFAIWFAQNIFCPSKFTKDEIVKYYPKVKKNKLIVTHNGFRPKDFQKKFTEAEVKEVLDKYKIDEAYFLFVGRIEEKKNIKNLLLAFDKYISKYNSSIKLVLVGKEGYKYSEIQKVKGEIKNKDKVIELGWVERDELLILLQNATTFLFPTYYEGFGFPILEAFASGVPVLTSKGGVYKELGGEAAEYVEPDNIEELARLMDLLQRNVDLREEMISKGFKRIELFSWEKTAKIIYDCMIS